MRKIDELPDIDFIDGATIEDVKAELINDFKSEYKRITGKEAHLSEASPYMMIINATALQIYQLMQYADNAWIILLHSKALSEKKQTEPQQY